MKSLSLSGILLVVLGALALAYQGITYTHREKVFDVGPIHATKDTQEQIPVPPILGGVALVGGVALLIVGRKAKSLTEVFSPGRVVSAMRSTASPGSRRGLLRPHQGSGETKLPQPQF
jgi:hypothetical protein